MLTLQKKKLTMLSKPSDVSFSPIKFGFSLFMVTKGVCHGQKPPPKKDYHRGRDNGMQYTAKQETRVFFLNSCCPLLLNTVDKSYSVLG